MKLEGMGRSITYGNEINYLINQWNHIWGNYEICDIFSKKLFFIEKHCVSVKTRVSGVIRCQRNISQFLKLVLFLENSSYRGQILAINKTILEERPFLRRQVSAKNDIFVYTG